jgi:hypothetical protein
MSCRQERVIAAPLVHLGPVTSALTLLCLLGTATPASADEFPVHRWREVWAGADVSSDVWLLYSGVTIAPWSHIHGEGWRFRAVGGYGRYRYEGDRSPAPGQQAARRMSFHAETQFADLLVGYLMRFGPLTAKSFVGASVVGHDIQPFDEDNLVIGDDFGVKSVVELWLNIGADAWGSLDVSWSSAHETRAARTRIGYRVVPSLSIGLEGGLNIDTQGDCDLGFKETAACKQQLSKQDASEAEDVSLLDYARVGTFVRYEWAGGEVSLSGGALGGSFKHEVSTDVSPHVTLNVLAQF